MRIAGRIIICLLLASVLVFALAGCDFSSPKWYGDDDQYAVNLNLSTNSINVGSVADLDIDILHPDDTKPVFTDPGDDSHLIVRDRSWDSRQLDDGRRITSVRYSLTSFELGEHQILKGDLKFVRDDKVVKKLKFDDLTLSVESLLEAGDSEMRDIAACSRYPARFPRWLPILLLIALLSAIVGAIFARIYRRRTPQSIEAPRPPADEIALGELRELRGKRWIEDHLIEPFYVELSRIVRNYIENRFGLRAPEQTTEEFIRDASESDRLSFDHRQLTSEFLSQSDMVKFARYEPDEDLMQQAFGSAERLVKETSSSHVPVNGEGATQ